MASPTFSAVNSKELIDVVDVCIRCYADASEEKINLIPGAYRDEDGEPWVLPVVLDLEKKLVQSVTYNHEYILFLGTDSFKTLAPRLILGEESPALRTGRALGIQTVGGSGALRIGAELLVRHAKYDTFYISEPTWDNHESTFLYAGFSTSRKYRYWDPVKRGVDFEGLIEDLREAPENSVIVLQLCAHNPTGCDLTKKQWTEVADVMEERKLFPIFDAAYQGFASGDVEEDAWAVRYFVDRGFEMLVTQSFSKNMGLYGDRVGCLTVVLKEGRQKELASVEFMLTIIARAIYLCPTRHGGEIVVRILRDSEARKQWLESLRKMVERLKVARQSLKERLDELGTPGNWNHITSQSGMFSFTGLTSKQAAYMADEHHMYLLPNGRANICALNDNNVDRFAQAVHDSITME
ncbi:aspartate aminotransferase, cytoplasmic-like [Zootermopsis nevadensis]|uniref:aspartate aminotransferase, cytoplasmic-like n=1 Tax=Zootermopsis nevadensis TaxID=136037 RepID=UPI000B8E835E|nr:aspartate aminotransferase, cytoplasmic-like [Zootermopsis nevadensis]